MNQGRIWCVVNPTVGLPLFLGSVAVTALVVHYSVLSNTSWFSGYWNGNAKPAAASTDGAVKNAAVSTQDAAGFTISVAPVAGNAANADTSFVITVAPKPAQVAQTDAKSVGALAMADGSLR